MTFAGWFSVVVGLMMLGQWGLSFAKGRVSEVRTEPIRLAFHVAAEFVTAGTLIVGGIGLLSHRSWGPEVFGVAAGMLVYSVIVSPGYFAQKRQWPPVVTFALLMTIAIVAIISVTNA